MTRYLTQLKTGLDKLSCRLTHYFYKFLKYLVELKFWVITQNEEATYCLLRPTMVIVKKLSSRICSTKNCSVQ